MHKLLYIRFIPANHPDLTGIVPIFELQNLMKLGHIDSLRKKKTLSLGSKVGIFDIFVVLMLVCTINISGTILKIGPDFSKSFYSVQYM